MGEPRMGAVDKWEANDYILTRKQNTKIASGRRSLRKGGRSKRQPVSSDKTNHHEANIMAPSRLIIGHWPGFQGPWSSSYGRRAVDGSGDRRLRGSSMIRPSLNVKIDKRGQTIRQLSKATKSD